MKNIKEQILEDILLYDIYEFYNNRNKTNSDSILLSWIKNKVPLMADATHYIKQYDNRIGVIDKYIHLSKGKIAHDIIEESKKHLSSLLSKTTSPTGNTEETIINRSDEREDGSNVKSNNNPKLVVRYKYPISIKQLNGEIINTDKNIEVAILVVLSPFVVPSLRIDNKSDKNKMNKDLIRLTFNKQLKDGARKYNLLPNYPVLAIETIMVAITNEDLAFIRATNRIDAYRNMSQVTMTEEELDYCEKELRKKASEH